MGTITEPVHGEIAAPGATGQELAGPRQASPAVAGDDPFFAMIERAARDPTISVEKLERLFELSERARAVRAKQAFAESFARLQLDLPSIDRKGRIVVYSKRDREKTGGPVEGVDTPQQSTPYATLDDILAAIRAPMAQHGFSIRFEHAIVPLGAVEGRIATTAVLTHREGHAESATTPPLLHDSSGSKNGVQSAGSSMKYGRRYSLMAVLPIVSHAPQDADDDGHAAGEKTAPSGISEEQVAELRGLIVQASKPEKIAHYAAAMLKRYKVERMEDLTPANFASACKVIRAQIAEQGGGAADQKGAA